MTTWVLVHSPLVGPATWRPVAAELRHQGHPVVVPTLSPAADVSPPYLPTHASEVVAAVRGSGHAGDDLVLAGHSGAGPRLPAIGAAMGKAGLPVGGYVFVDAGLPSGEPARATLPAEFAALLDGLVRPDGTLPRWSDWFGEGALAELLPDDVVRAEIEAELRPVPYDLFDDPIPVPARWPDAPCAYVNFTYDAEAADAEARGWPVRRLGGHHLSLVTDPAATSGAMIAVAGSR